MEIVPVGNCDIEYSRNPEAGLWPDRFETIRIDGTPIAMPSYALDLTPEQLWYYLENSAQIREHGIMTIFVGGNPERYDWFDEDIFEKITYDDNWLEYHFSILRAGPETVDQDHRINPSIDQSESVSTSLVPHKDQNNPTGLCTFSYSRCAAAVAKELATQNVGLEIIPSQARLLSWHASDGMILLRGSGNEISCSDNGIIYVEGNAESVGGASGMVYVSGSVGQIDNAEDVIKVAIGGEVSACALDKGHPNPCLETKRVPSPFIFASHPLDGVLRALNVPWSNPKDPYERYIHFDQLFSSIWEINEKQLQEWNPRETRKNLIKLCKERTQAALQNISELAGSTNDPRVFDAIWKKILFGHNTGHTDGMLRQMNKRPAISWD